MDGDRAMARRIALKVAEMGGRVYYVGGLVRDEALGLESKDVDIEVQKPRIPITKDNYKYLQILDAINGLDQAPIDAAEPELIIRQKAQCAGLQAGRLILYARMLYPTETLKKTIDIMLGGIAL